MTSATIPNAAPMTYVLGTQDLSARKQVVADEVVPSHLPVVYLYTKKGPEDIQLVVGNGRTSIYGAESFDLRQKWATHATVLSNTVNDAGNSHFIGRIKPVDAKTATLRLWLDVLPTMVTDYQRNSDGSIKLDGVTGLPVPVTGQGATVSGFKVKFVVTEATDTQGEANFGAATQMPGDLTDGTSAQSTRHPIADFQVSSFGAWGSNVGIRMWAPTVNSAQAVDTRILTDEGVYPFRISVIERTSAIATPKVAATLGGDQLLNFSFKSGVIDKNTDLTLSLGDTFIDAYQDLDHKYSTTPTFGQFSDMHIYSTEIETLLAEFLAAEIPFIDAFSDFLDDGSDETFKFNFLSGVSSQNVPYHSFQIVTADANAVRLTETSNVYALGGADGTMSEALFAPLVGEAIQEWADVNSPLQNMLKYPASIFYDSGFPLDTKYELCNFMAARKDLAVVLSTHDVLGPQLTASEESSLAISLTAHLKSFPESDVFGTATVRGMVMGRSGKLLGSQYTKMLPLTIELAAKAAAYMGAGDGNWKNAYNFDSQPNSVISLFTKINVTSTPAAVQNKDWANGLNYIEPAGRSTYYFPALKTVFPDDTSVLTSFFTMMAICELEKIGVRAHTQISGTSSMTDGQVIDRVNKFIIEKSNGRFDGRFIIASNAYYTAADKARGYSWTTEITIYAPNMKTVQTLIIQSQRIEDAPATTPTN